MSDYTLRHTGRGIVVHEGKVLLMQRWRAGMHYFSIPGGGIEAGETPEQTAVREIAEETTLVVTAGREVYRMEDGPINHHIFLCEYVNGQPHLPADAPEFLLRNLDNRFEPGWFVIPELLNMPFNYWEPIKQLLLNALQNGFGDDITIVPAAINT